MQKEKKEDKEMMNQLNQKLDYLTGVKFNPQFMSRYEEYPLAAKHSKPRKDGVN